MQLAANDSSTFAQISSERGIQEQQDENTKFLLKLSTQERADRIVTPGPVLEDLSKEEEDDLKTAAVKKGPS